LADNDNLYFTMIILIWTINLEYVIVYHTPQRNASSTDHWALTRRSTLITRRHFNVLRSLQCRCVPDLQVAWSARVDVVLTAVASTLWRRDVAT